MKLNAHWTVRHKQQVTFSSYQFPSVSYHILFSGSLRILLRIIYHVRHAFTIKVWNFNKFLSIFQAFHKCKQLFHRSLVIAFDWKILFIFLRICNKECLYAEFPNCKILFHVISYHQTLFRSKMKLFKNCSVIVHIWLAVTIILISCDQLKILCIQSRPFDPVHRCHLWK